MTIFKPDKLFIPVTEISSGYRPDIDGLRAVAVLSALFFHVGFAPFAGGFSGVEVFFVISGYLITRLIVLDVNKNRFSLKNFYVRRVRRLFPALCFTLIASYVAAFFLLAPVYMERFSLASIFTLLFSSNMLFWSEAGYFDIESSFKPLLHTWSLGVEEQFYFLWPLPLILLLRKKTDALVPIVVILLFIFSFFLNYFAANGVFQVLLERTSFQESPLADIRSSIFYLLPFRVFEFAIGALMVWVTPGFIKNEWIKELLFLAGLAMILIPVFVYNENLVYPYYYALVPCLGAALVIFSENPKIFGILLRNRLAVGIGLISYSLYLAHWPLIVYFKYYHFGYTSLSSMYLLCAASIVLAIFMYFFIEQPFRGKKSYRFNINTKTSSFLYSCLALSLLIGGISYHAWANDGWKGRSLLQDNIFSSLDLKAENKKRGQVMRNLCDTDKTVRAGCVDDSRPNGMIVGNSHGVDGLNIMHSIYGDEHSFLLSAIGGCPPILPEDFDAKIGEHRPSYLLCKELTRWRFSKGFYSSMDYVVVSSSFNRDNFSPEDLRHYIEYLQAEGVEKIIVIGSHYKMKNRVYDIGTQGDYRSIEQLVGEFLAGDPFLYNDEVKQVCDELGCLFIDKKEILCNENGQRCKVSVNGIPFSLDKSHLTYEFSRFLGEHSTAKVKSYLSGL